MKFNNKIKQDLKPNKSSIKELVFCFCISFLIFLITEILSALGTTSHGTIKKSEILLGISTLSIIYVSLFVAFKRDTKRGYILEAILLLVISPFVKSSWDKFYIFLEVPDYSIWCFILEYLIIFCIMGISFLLKRKRFYYVLMIGLIAILSIANYLVSTFRGLPLAYSDIYCIKDAMAISSQYITPSIVLVMLLCLSLFIISLFILYKKDKSAKRMSSYFNIIALLFIVVGSSIYYYRLITDKTLIYYSANMVKTYRYNGYIYSTLESGLRFIRFKPNDYNKETLASIKENIEGKYTKEKNTEVASKKITSNMISNNKKPNILFVQLEGFIDPTTIDGIMFSEDPIPNFRKLQKECINGYLKTPSIGGGTARTEFEVMTGIDLEFLTDGEVPHYTILGHKPLNSIATTLKKQSYSAHAIHNNEGNFYNRNKAYSSLGYDNYVSIEYMDNIERTETNWAKDTVLTDYIDKTLKSTENPDVVFTISVEGHSPYPKDSDKYDLDIKVSNSKLSKDDQNQLYYFANKINDTDKFVGETIDLIDSLDEDTIVVFYGDHTPSLDILNKGRANIDRTVTPYAIYSNFELNSDVKNKDLCAYQLSTFMFNLAGVELGPMEKVHQTLGEDENYKKGLELIQYDVLFGKDYYLSQDEKPYESNLKMGIDEIKISNIEKSGGHIYINGENFTKSSEVFINDKKLETTYLDNKRLLVSYGGDIKSLVVKQIGLHEIPLSESNDFIK